MSSTRVENFRSKFDAYAGTLPGYPGTVSYQLWDTSQSRGSPGKSWAADRRGRIPLQWLPVQLLPRAK
eukprot:3911574-Rhodomonas_salina.1